MSQRVSQKLEPRPGVCPRSASDGLDRRGGVAASEAIESLYPWDKYAHDRTIVEFAHGLARAPLGHRLSIRHGGLRGIRHRSLLLPAHRVHALDDQPEIEGALAQESGRERDRGVEAGAKGWGQEGRETEREIA